MLIYKSDIARQAEKHTEEMETHCHDRIEYCINNTQIFTGVNGTTHNFVKKGDVFSDHISFIKKEACVNLMQATTTDALAYLISNKDGDVTILNFASYKNAGGAFLGGSMAQEEALCHESFLYNVLRKFPEYYKENCEHLNKGLYLDRALYTPEVMFRGALKANVITCACPNKTPLVRYNAFTEAENHEALKNRITFLRDILLTKCCDHVILGAWGCGVFRQDAKEVAELFKEVFKETDLNIVYAIPDDRNFKAFEDVFGKDKAIDVNRTAKEQKEINRNTARWDGEIEL